MPAFLDDGCGVKDAVEAAVACPVKAVAFLVGGIDGDGRTSFVAGELGGAGEASEFADLGDQDGAEIYVGEDLADVDAQLWSVCERGQRGEPPGPGEVSGGVVEPEMQLGLEWLMTIVRRLTTFAR